MSEDAVTYQSRDRIATITINRAERMNRLDDAIVEGLHQCWRRFMASDEDRVAILTGAGDKAFTAGADLKALPTTLYRGIPGWACLSTSRSSARWQAGSSAAAWCSPPCATS